VAKTQDIYDHCAGLAHSAFPVAGGACKAADAAVYLAHTGRGETLHALAAVTGTHPSTVLRSVRRVEERRDDPLFDTMLGALERQAGESAPAPDSVQPDPQAANDNQPLAAFAAPVDRGALEREARRFLRRLSEPGSFLVIARDAAKGGVFCKANDYRKPIAMMPAGVAVEFLREAWIRIAARGTATIRYRITADGRSFLKRLLAEDAIKRQPATGFAEAATPFLAQHQIPGARTLMDRDTGEPKTLKVNLGEDPLGWLASRKGPDGKAFLTPDEVEAGNRLRTDFEIAQIGPSVAQDWRKFLTPGDKYSGSPVSRGPGEGPMAARDRVGKALSALGPGLSDVVLRVCCFLEGLEACERRMGWSARSGKVVLKIALQRLAEHYGYAAARP
jgi:hypothetical protein